MRSDNNIESVVRGPGWVLTLAVFTVCGCAGQPIETDARGEEVALLAPNADIDTHTCQGTRCERADVEAPALPNDVRTCEIDRETLRSVPHLSASDLCQALVGSGELDDCSSTQYNGDAYQLAPDGSLWFVGLASTDERDGQVDVLVAAHFAAGDGELISSRVLDRVESDLGEAVMYDARLAIDTRGHALIAAQRRVLRETDLQPDVSYWFIELDERGEELRRLTLDGPRDPWTTDAWLGMQAIADNRVLLSPGGRMWGGLTVLDTERGEALWVQPRADERSAVRDATADRRGAVSALAVEETFVAAEKPIATLEHYAADGMLEWVRTLESPFPAASGLAALSADANGDVVLSAQGFGFLPTPQPIYVQKVSADGEQQWLTRIDLAGALWTSPEPTLDDAGNIWIVGDTYNESSDTEPGRYGQNLYRISKDGRRCVRFEVPDVSLERLSYRDGVLYAFSGNTVSRLE